MGESSSTKKALLDLPFLKKLKGIKNIEIIIALRCCNFTYLL